MRGSEASRRKDHDGSALDEYTARLRSRYGACERVLLVALPQMVPASFDRRAALLGGCYAFPPAGLQYLYEAIADRVPAVRILDTNLETLKRVRGDDDFGLDRWIEILEGALEDFAPHVVGVSCLFDASLRFFLEALELLRRRDRSVVVTGGPLPTYEFERLLSDGLCHFVVQREGERRFGYLLDRLGTREVADRPVDGIWFLHDGFLTESGGSEGVPTFEDPIIRSYSAIEIGDYSEHGSLNPFSRMAGGRFATVQMSRGCRADCAFCSVRSLMGRRVRTRPVDVVFREIEYLATHHGVRHFEWLDDDLLYPRDSFIALLERIIRSGLRITWSASNGLLAAALDRPLLDLMRDAGCIGFRIGIESGNDRRLRSLGKPGRSDLYRRVSRLLRSEYPEMFVVGLFLIGFPGETFGEMMDTFRLIRDLGLDWAGISTCQPIRGARLFDDRSDVFDEQMESFGATVRNYVPIRQTPGHELRTSEGTVSGPDVLRLPPDCIPDADQIQEIWFTYNLLSNYIGNPHLAPGGDVRKCIAWLSAVQAAYPRNPYIRLFLALARRIAGDDEGAARQFAMARALAGTPYWTRRLREFGLMELIEHPPASPEGVHEALEKLGEQTGLPRRRPDRSGRGEVEDAA